MPADLAADTAVHAVSGTPGRYRAELTSSWNFRSPSGGVLLTVALRAIRAELADAGLKPRSATALFSSIILPGPIEVQVMPVRRGNVAAQLRATLTSLVHEGPGLEVVATFSRDREGFDFTDAEPPTAPRPELAPPLGAAVPFSARARPPFFDNFDCRLASGSDWYGSEWQPGPARFARWFRYLVPQQSEDGLLDRLALPPLADTMPPSVVEKLGPGFPRFIAPSLDLTVHFLDDTPREWLLVSAHTKRAHAGYASAEVEIRDDEGRLVACGSQVMMFRRPPRHIV